MGGGREGWFSSAWSQEGPVSDPGPDSAGLFRQTEHSRKKTQAEEEEHPDQPWWGTAWEQASFLEYTNTHRYCSTLKQTEVDPRWDVQNAAAPSSGDSRLILDESSGHVFTRTGETGLIGVYFSVYEQSNINTSHTHTHTDIHTQPLPTAIIKSH